MSSLKDFLEKAILKAGSRAAMPGGNIIVVVDSDTKPSASSGGRIAYVAPTDGYLAACAKNPASGGAAGNLHIYNKTTGGIFSAYQPSGVNTRVKATIPARKGDEIQVSSYQSAFIVDRVEFVKTVGGGLNRLIRLIFSRRTHGFA